MLKGVWPWIISAALLQGVLSPEPRIRNFLFGELEGCNPSIEGWEEERDISIGGRGR